MKTFKNFFAVIAITAVLGVSSTFAGDGILVAGFDGEPEDPCVAETKAAYNEGILVAGITGILVAGFTGILVAGVSGDSDGSQDTCGILVAG